MNKKEAGPDSLPRLSREDIELFDSIFKAELTNKSGNQGLKTRSITAKKVPVSTAVDGAKKKVKAVGTSGVSRGVVDQASSESKTSTAPIPDGRNQKIKADSKKQARQAPAGESVARRRAPSATAPTAPSKGISDNSLKRKQDILINKIAAKNKVSSKGTDALEKKETSVNRPEGEKPNVVEGPVAESSLPEQASLDPAMKPDQDEISDQFPESEKETVGLFEKIKAFGQERLVNGPTIFKVVLPGLVLAGLIVFLVNYFGFPWSGDAGDQPKTVKTEPIPTPAQASRAGTAKNEVEETGTTITAKKNPGEKPPIQKQTVQKSASQPTPEKTARTTSLKRRPILKMTDANTSTTAQPEKTIDRTSFGTPMAQGPTSTSLTPRPEAKTIPQRNDQGNQQILKQPATKSAVPSAPPNTSGPALLAKEVGQNETPNTPSDAQTPRGAAERPETVLSKTSTGASGTSTPKPESHDREPEPALAPQPTKTPAKSVGAYADDVLYPYSIYLGSYRTLGRAKKSVSMFEKQGLSSYWVKVDLGKKGIWYRIFTGHFHTENEAEAFLKKNQLKDAAVKRTRYSNLIGVYTSKMKLKQTSSALSQMEYSPYVIEASNGKYRLYAGAFYTKAGAETLAKELASEGISCSVVER